MTPALRRPDASQTDGMDLRSPRSIAFYLPQFHPTPENDEFWGAGFTEWRNVAKAKPAFRGHYQPHIPADLGFYDLRLAEVLVQQAQLAATYGVYGFCWYHYWFNGRRLLNRPFDEMSRSGEPKYPYCLCWANESWTRAWYGMADHVLVDQRYSDADHRAHMRFLANAFADDRYIRVDGRPLFLVYRPNLIPDLHAATDIWREEAARMGLADPYLVRIERLAQHVEDPKLSGFDAAATFHPNRSCLPPYPILRRATNNGVIRKTVSLGMMRRRPRRVEYDTYAALACAEPPVTYTRFPIVFPRWDNTARFDVRALVFVDCTPERYRGWLEAALNKSPLRGEQDIVFINGWNEWSEGAHLEPDLRYGKAFLEQTQAALSHVSVRAARVR